MHINYDCPTISSAGGQVHCGNLPCVAAPVATDCLVFINPSNGAQITPIAAIACSAGAGSPEGVVIASPGARYWDTTDKVDYVKDSGTSSTGWLATIG